MTQIQEIENLSQPDLVKLVRTERQQHADDMDMLSKELAGRSFTVPEDWKKQFKDEVYQRFCAADNQDVPLEEYPDIALEVLDKIVGPRHPTVIKWRNDAIKQCIAIAYKYCRDPESHNYLKQDLEAMLTAAPAAPVAAQAQWIEHCNITDIPDAVLTPSGLAIKSEQADTQEPAASASFALRYAAKVIELYDDATMRADYMLTSTDCAEILEALAEYFTAHPRVSEPQLVHVYKTNDISGLVDTDLSQPCTCPSGNGSLRPWPCPVHPPESINLTKSSNQQVSNIDTD